MIDVELERDDPVQPLDWWQWNTLLRWWTDRRGSAESFVRLFGEQPEIPPHADVVALLRARDVRARRRMGL